MGVWPCHAVDFRIAGTDSQAGRRETEQIPIASVMALRVEFIGIASVMLGIGLQLWEELGWLEVWIA